MVSVLYSEALDCIDLARCTPFVASLAVRLSYCARVHMHVCMLPTFFAAVTISMSYALIEQRAGAFYTVGIPLRQTPPFLSVFSLVSTI
jgi:hypothetical protein